MEQFTLWSHLEVALISAAFDQDVSLTFTDDGVYQLTAKSTNRWNWNEKLLIDIFCPWRL